MLGALLWIAQQSVRELPVLGWRGTPPDRAGERGSGREAVSQADQSFGSGAEKTRVTASDGKDGAAGIALGEVAEHDLRLDRTVATHFFDARQGDLFETQLTVSDTAGNRADKRLPRGCRKGRLFGRG